MDETTVAACYQIILEGRYGSLPAVYEKETVKVKVIENGKEVEKEVERTKEDKMGNPVHKFWRVAASNTENDFSNVNSSSLALLRRFSHLSVTPTSKGVVNYFSKKGLDPRVTAYLANSPEDLFPQIYDEKLVENKANPFPSTWENVGLLIEPHVITPKTNRDDAKKISEKIYHLTASCVGAALASKFIAYIDTVSKIDIDAIIKDPAKELKEIKKQDNKAALLYSIVFSIAYSWQRKERNIKGQNVIDICEQLPPEFGTAFLKSVLEKRAREITNGTKGWDRLLTSLGKYFD